MDEEMKNAEQAGNEMKNEAGSIFDQVKEMLGDAANDGAGVFDKLKGMLEGKAIPASLRRQRRCLTAKKASLACWTNSRKCLTRAPQLPER